MACGSMRTTRLPKSMAMMTQSEDGYRCTHTSCPVCLEEVRVTSVHSIPTHASLAVVRCTLLMERMGGMFCRLHSLFCSVAQT